MPIRTPLLRNARPPNATLMLRRRARVLLRHVSDSNRCDGTDSCVPVIGVRVTYTYPYACLRFGRPEIACFPALRGQGLTDGHGLPFFFFGSIHARHPRVLSVRLRCIIRREHTWHFGRPMLGSRSKLSLKLRTEGQVAVAATDESFFLLLVVTLLSNVPVRMPTHMSMQMSMHRAVEHVYLHMSTHICMLIHMSIRGISSTARSTSKQQHGDEESDTSNMHASYNMHGACLTAYSVVRHATCNMQHATCNMHQKPAIKQTCT